MFSEEARKEPYGDGARRFEARAFLWARRFELERSFNASVGRVTAVRNELDPSIVVSNSSCDLMMIHRDDVKCVHIKGGELALTRMIAQVGLKNIREAMVEGTHRTDHFFDRWLLKQDPAHREVLSAAQAYNQRLKLLACAVFMNKMPRGVVRYQDGLGSSAVNRIHPDADDLIVSSAMFGKGLTYYFWKTSAEDVDIEKADFLIKHQIKFGYVQSVTADAGDIVVHKGSNGSQRNWSKVLPHSSSGGERYTQLYVR